MSLALAPMAFKRPISRVRSVTVTNIIFIMPMPPTKREIAAIPDKTVVRVPVIELTLSIISRGFLKLKSALSGFSILWRDKSRFSISVEVCSIKLLSTTRMEMLFR